MSDRQALIRDYANRLDQLFRQRHRPAEVEAELSALLRDATLEEAQGVPRHEPTWEAPVTLVACELPQAKGLPREPTQQMYTAMARVHGGTPHEIWYAGWDAAPAAPTRDEQDARRLDLLEACIRDGSYLSIFNDIIAVCQHAYATFGPGPALRTAIDAALAEPKR